MGRHPRDLRVDDHELHAALHEVDDPVTEQAVGVGHERIVAPDEHRLGRLVLGVFVAVGELLRAVGDPKRAGLREAADDAGKVAGDAGQRERVVGRAHRGGEARDVGGDVAPRAVSREDGLGAVGVGDFLERGVDEIVRFLPADALPHVLAAILRVALHGVAQPVLMMRHVGNGKAPHAQAAFRKGILGVAFALDERAVLVGVEQHPAAIVASRPRPCDRAGDREPVLFVLERFLMRDQYVSSVFHATSSLSSDCRAFKCVY